MSAFRVPVVQDNPDGWGPVSGPAHLEGIPYAPFGKGDKLGKVSDWTQQNYQRNFGRLQQGQVGAVFNYFHNEEEESFKLVDNRPVRTNKYGNRRFQQHRFQRRDDRDSHQQDNQNRHHQQRKQQPRRGWWHREPQKTVVYSSSVEIKPEWNLREQVEFSSLAKLFQKVEDPEDLVSCGALEFYDRAYDRVTPKTGKTLVRTQRVFRSVTTSDDPVMRRLAAEDKGKIFVTDQILTTIMCAPRSVYSWDVVVTRIADKIFFDKRDQSSISLLTVNETAPDPVQEEKDNINGVQQLSLEATMVNQNFSQQVLRKGGKYKFPNPNPFELEDDPAELASCAYRYRKLKLSPDGDMDIIVRCEVDAVMVGENQKPQLVSIKALNEFPAKQGAGLDWRRRLETQRGAVFATEFKNNSNKLHKWTAGAVLGGVDVMKLGYVTRTNSKDNQRHVILGTQLCRPQEFADQINLKMGNCWGIVRAVAELCMKCGDGKYLLIKDPNKPMLRLYEIPGDAFEDNYTEQ